MTQKTVCSDFVHFSSLAKENFLNDALKSEMTCGTTQAYYSLHHLQEHVGAGNIKSR